MMTNIDRDGMEKDALGSVHPLAIMLYLFVIASAAALLSGFH